MSATLGPEGIILGGETPSGKLDAIGQIPLLVTDNDGVTSWVPAVLLNSTSTVEPAYAIFSSSALGIFFKKWSNRFPASDPTPDSMPMGNVSSMWGDYHLLGDIVWLADRDQPFSINNAARFSHGIWFSQPESAESWDPIDVVFIGQGSDDNRIVGMFPTQAGLIVLSTNGAHMLRGNPDYNQYELLRSGVGPSSSKSATYWPAAGVVVWLDERGQVWQTNGENFGRLDSVLPPVVEPCNTSIVSFDDFLIISRNSRMYALRLIGGEGVWTELNSSCTKEMRRYEGSVYMAKTAGGLERFAPEYPARGHKDDVPVASRVATRTLQADDSHQRGMWHRFGVRMRGTGDAVSASTINGPYLADDSDGIDYEIGEAVEGRYSKVFPAHGPSKEASFAVEGKGDVVYESMTVWAHGGKDRR